MMSDLFTHCNCEMKILRSPYNLIVRRGFLVRQSLLSLSTGLEHFRTKNGVPNYSTFYDEIGVGFEMPVHFSKMTALENMKFFSGFYRKTGSIQELMERVVYGSADV